ncbi:MAG: cation-transporting P-type ATPase [Balneolaceae bacterium]|jgi:Ca2+-transporting ATPase
MNKESNSATDLPHPWALEAEEVVDLIKSDADQGLTNREVHQRLQEYGRNQLKEHKKRSFLSIFIDQFKSIIILLLIIAAFFAFWLGEHIDGWAIAVVILINSFIGFFTELRAVRSMEALFKLGKVKTRVRREGTVKEVDAEELVPGDVVIVEGGDIITADLRIIESSKMQADESPLTGESLPVEKHIEALAEDTILAERSDMLYKGTSVTRGAGEGVVVSTGLRTELGQISSLVEEAREEQTPLEKRLTKLGYRLIAITLLIAIFVAVSGIVAGKNLYLMVETGIALAVAAIPEGLPIVATIALAKGLQIMAGKNALINRLSSVETLGATGIICTDKTGTLTENRMTITHFYLPQKEIKVGDGEHAFSMNGRQVRTADDEDLRLALEVGTLCNNAALFDQGDGGTGDPLEVALLNAARKGGIEFSELIQQYPEAREEAFDADVKMMATWNQVGEGSFRVNVKGAPGSVLKKCDSVIVSGRSRALDDQQRTDWEQLNEKLASQGLRMIALAVKSVSDTKGNPYTDLSFVGLAAMSDPPRKDVRPAIEDCRKAGIRVVMITGDQVATAKYIARELGIYDDREAGVIHGADLPGNPDLEASLNKSQHVLRASIFARINPRQKLDLIEFYQKNGQIVAMTGDGVNDAPALKKADIGIAMGQRGTQVAREAADMVLTDDAFSTIVKAIEQGRIIFGNIRRFIYYLMSCNVSEVMVVGLASILGTPLPILPLQILFLNLVTDVFPALALGVGEGEKGIMLQPPREPDQPLLGNPQWMGVAIYGFIITLSVLGALFVALDYLRLPPGDAVTISFLTLAFAQIWHVFNMRSDKSHFIDNNINRNPYIWVAILLCIGLLMIAVYVPGIASVLQISRPDFQGWLTVGSISLIPFILGQFRKILLRG